MQPSNSFNNAAWLAEHAPWKISTGPGPVVATAIHAGHDVRPEIRRYYAISDQQRRREEDPLTSFWTTVGDSSVSVFRSRFEVDLNRPRETAIVMDPQAAWGLSVWNALPPPEMLERSLAVYDAFYAQMRTLFDELTRIHGRILVLDFHSYNHRREGVAGPPADACDNPDINVGTATMRRESWHTLVDTFIAALGSATVQGRPLDVRENIKFKGGYFPAWLHSRYPQHVCTLSIECKKIFMDEWSAQVDIGYMDELRDAFLIATSAVRRVLRMEIEPP